MLKAKKQCNNCFDCIDENTDYCISNENFNDLCPFCGSDITYEIDNNYSKCADCKKIF